MKSSVILGVFATAFVLIGVAGFVILTNEPLGPPTEPVYSPYYTVTYSIADGPRTVPGGDPPIDPRSGLTPVAFVSRGEGRFEINSSMNAWSPGTPLVWWDVTIDLFDQPPYSLYTGGFGVSLNHANFWGDLYLAPLTPQLGVGGEGGHASISFSMVAYEGMTMDDALIIGLGAPKTITKV